MPNFITARMFLEDQSAPFGEKRNLVGAVVLNEGFDGAYWSWTNDKHAEKPSQVETFALDGLVKIFKDFTEFDPGPEYEEARKAAKALRDSSDLDLAAYKEVVMGALNNAPDHLYVSVMVYSDSTLRNQLDIFSRARFPVRLFREVASD